MVKYVKQTLNISNYIEKDEINNDSEIYPLSSGLGDNT